MFAIIICSLLAGVCLTLLIELLLCYKWSSKLPIALPSWVPQTEPYVLPAQLQDALGMLEADKKEKCVGLNMMLQFLFQELKDTRKIRRWVMRRMQREFAEMMQQSTTGKLIEQITVRDFNLGSTFPIIRSVTTNNVVTNEDNMIDSVTLLLDLTYNGRFQLAIDADMVFGRSAYLSVMMTKLQGVARLQFTRLPFTHWSFAFTHDPVLDFEVESQFEGRPVPQLASIIIGQIRKSVRKKHTLPAYKLRYQPFFTMPTPAAANIEHSGVYFAGSKLSVGHLRVFVINCTRLVQLSTSDAHIFCSVSVDSMPWVQLQNFRLKQYKTFTVEIVKTAGASQTIGMEFTDTYMPDRGEEVVMVTNVTPGLPADLARIVRDDILASINGAKVLNKKQVARVMRQTTDRIILIIERSMYKKSGSVAPSPVLPTRVIPTPVVPPPAVPPPAVPSSVMVPNAPSVDLATVAASKLQPVTATENEDDTDDASLGNSLPGTHDEENEENFVDTNSEHSESGIPLADTSKQSATASVPLSNPAVFVKQPTDVSKPNSFKPDESSSSGKSVITEIAFPANRPPSGLNPISSFVGKSAQAQPQSVTSNTAASVAPSATSINSTVKFAETSTSAASKPVSLASSKVGAMPAQAKKGLTQIISTSSALFQRKKQRRLSDPKTISFSTANSTVTVSEVPVPSSIGTASGSNASTDATDDMSSSQPNSGRKDGSFSVSVGKSNVWLPTLDENKLELTAADNSDLLTTKTKTTMSDSVDSGQVNENVDDSILTSAMERKANESDPKTRKNSQGITGSASNSSLDQASSQASLVTTGTANTSAASSSQPILMIPSDVDDGLQKTHSVRPCTSPAFNERFDFDVSSNAKYVNVCIWCRLPPKLDKQQRLTKPAKDVLIGHTSIELMDIALNCLTTLQGDFTETFVLTPAELKLDIGKPQFANLSTHPGFNEQFCYGDITLRFQYSWNDISTVAHKKLLKQYDGIEHLLNMTDVHSRTVSQKLPNSSEKPNTQLPQNAVDGGPSGKKNHNFTIVQFQSSTYCDFCSKKIWLKSAFRCSECLKVCHKKCVEKCQSLTICTRTKPKIDKKPEAQSKLDGTETTRPPADSKLLSGAGMKTTVSAAVMREESERKRHISAPDESHSDTESTAAMVRLGDAIILPRPRSSNSLDDLTNRSSTPTIEELMSTATTSALVGEDEYKLVQLFERARRVQNSDEIVVTKAKKMGKELFAELDPDARKQKLDSIISKLQSEIDNESEHRADLARKARTTPDKKHKSAIETKMEKSDEKLDSMTVLMLHYCAGLQHCLDQEEVERLKKIEPEGMQQEDGELTGTGEVGSEVDGVDGSIGVSVENLEEFAAFMEAKSGQEDVVESGGGLCDDFEVADEALENGDGVCMKADPESESVIEQQPKVNIDLLELSATDVIRSEHHSRKFIIGGESDGAAVGDSKDLLELDPPAVSSLLEVATPDVGVAELADN